MTVPPSKVSSGSARSHMERRPAVMLPTEATARADDRYEDMLRRSGFRPTRQRVALACILFSKGGRHVTAETLHEEAVQANMQVSLATVYNTLNQFTKAGLLRRIGVDGSKSFFDTNLRRHNHFFIQREDVLLDIPSTEILLNKLPDVPEGFEIAHVDVVVRLRPQS